jgi:hypothetical protein
MSDTITVENTSLRDSQLALARELPETRPFLHGEGHMGLRVHEDVYENARLANLREMNGGNIWDEPEFRADMLRRHPEISGKVRSSSFRVHRTAGPLTAPRNRFGKVSRRIWFEPGRRIEEADGIREIHDLDSGAVRRYNMKTGERL